MLLLFYVFLRLVKEEFSEYFGLDENNLNLWYNRYVKRIKENFEIFLKFVKL